MNALRLLCFLAFFLTGLGAVHAQLRPPIALGGGLDYNVDVRRTGLFLRGAVAPDTLWRVAGTFNYFFEGRAGSSQWELAADAHYFFWENQRLRAYLIGGLNLYHFTRNAPPGEPDTADRRGNKFGINMGAGLETRLNDRVYPFAEMKVSVGDGSLFGIYVGFTYRLEGRR